MMKKVMCILEKIFYVLFCIFNIAVLSCAMERNVYVKGTDEQIGMEKCIILLLIVLVIILCMGLKDNTHWKKDMFLIFLGSMLVRCVVILFIGIETNQVSDFGTAYNTAAGQYKDTVTGVVKEVIFSNWGAYPLYLRAVMRVFGESVFVCVIGNAVLASISGCLIYNLCRISNKARGMAVSASILFCCWPSYLAYTIVLTPEHVNIVLTLLSVNVLVWTCTKRFQNARWQYALFAFSGACLAAAFFFKSVSLIVLIGLTIMLILELPKLWNDCRATNNIKKDIYKVLLKIGCFLVAYFITVQAGYLVLDLNYGQAVNRDITSYYIATGLNVEGNGRYSPDLVSQFKEKLGTEADFEAADQMMKDVIKENLEKLKGEWKEFFTGKFELAWRSDEYTSFVQKTINAEGKALIDIEKWYPYFMGIVHYFYTVMCGIMLLATIINIFKKKNDKLIFFSQLFIFGLMCLLLISEAQPRYKCVIYPYWAIVVAYGIENVVKTIGMVIWRHVNEILHK